MPFITETTAYEKTALSDLQGAWINLRDEVVERFGFENCDKLLFHIDEAMSWEVVRNLNRMKAILLVVRNIAIQSGAPDEILASIELVSEYFEEAVLAIKQGESE